MIQDLDTLLENHDHLEFELRLLLSFEFEEFAAEDDDPIQPPQQPVVGKSETIIHKLF